MKSPEASRPIPWTLVVALVAMVIPFLGMLGEITIFGWKFTPGSRHHIDLATYIVIFAAFATSLHLLIGSTGLVAFGHAAYFGVGAYFCGILMGDYGVPFRLDCR